MLLQQLQLPDGFSVRLEATILQNDAPTPRGDDASGRVSLQFSLHDFGPIKLFTERFPQDRVTDLSRQKR